MPRVLKIVSVITVLSYLLVSSGGQMTAVSRTDIINFVNSTSLACQTTVFYCIALSHEAQILLSNGKYCFAMRLEFSGVSARHCLISLGFCTVNEFTLMENQACEKTHGDSDQIRLEASSQFYDGVNATSVSCLENLIPCIKGNPLATLYKQQKSFCYLMDENSTSAAECMIRAGSCTENEVKTLIEIACHRTNATSVPLTGGPDNRLSEAVHASSLSCRTGLDRCWQSGGHDVFEMLMKERYCWLLDAVDEDDYSARNCLVNSGQCSDDELLTLKQAACVGCIAQYSLISLLFCCIIHQIISFTMFTK